MFSYIFFTCLGIACGYLLGQRKDIDVEQVISNDLEKIEIEFISDEMDFADSIVQEAQSEQGAEALSPEQQADEVIDILNKH